VLFLNQAVTSCPEGYPQLATFLDSDESFMIYRRFGFIQSRLLLNTQDELRVLEQALERLDRREAKKDIRYPRIRNLPEEQMGPRTKLLKLIENKFCSYGKFLSEIATPGSLTLANLLDAAQKMVALHRPSKGDYRSVQNFMGNRTPLINEHEASWVKHEEDLVTLRAGREHAWLDTGIEKLLKCFHCSLLEVRRNPEFESA
jgi:hypothetical protein